MKTDECQGIITLRDVRKTIAKYGLNSFKKKVRDMMTKKLITISPNSTSGEAGDVMDRKRIDHLPVVDEKGVIKGIVSSKDLMILPWRGTSILVREIMIKKVVTITSTSSLVEAVKLMEKKGVASLLVKP